jgi:pimeloyl-ACP methyl ester carboxylesterase
MKTLPGSSAPVELDTPGYRLQAPGLQGTVKEFSAQAGTRALGSPRDEAFRAACKSSEVAMPKEFEIEITDDVLPPAASGTRADGLTAATREGQPAMVFSMPHLGAGRECAVLYQDEYGIPHWIFPQTAAEAGASTRGGGPELAFHLPRPRRVPGLQDSAASESTRGLFGTLGRPVIKVVAWTTKDLVGGAALAAAQVWEERARPYGLHQILPDKYKLKKPEGQPVDWSALNKGRALLLVHGTFSTSEGSYASFSKESLEALHQHYQGRVFAFNHPSLHHSPAENIHKLLSLIPAEAGLELDVMGHSRGGLVVREFLSQVAAQPEGARRIKVHKAILVAAPNLGTPLTNPDHAIEMLDRWTSLLNKLPDNTYTIIMESILMLVKLVGYGALSGLPGLSTMRPGSDYLNTLNAGALSGIDLYAMGANYAATDPNLFHRLAKTALDNLIDDYIKEDNDRLVPVKSISSAAPDLPGRRKIFTREEGIHHNSYFGEPGPQAQLLEWLVK